MPYLGLICSLFRTKLNKKKNKLPTLTIQFIKAVCAWVRKKFQNCLKMESSKFKWSRFTDTESNLLEMFSFLLEIESLYLCVVKCLVSSLLFLTKETWIATVSWRTSILSAFHVTCKWHEGFSRVWKLWFGGFRLRTTSPVHSKVWSGG